MRLIGFMLKVRLNVCSIPTYQCRNTFGILLVYFLWAVNDTWFVVCGVHRLAVSTMRRRQVDERPQNDVIILST
jgi:hypothetical protein